MFCYLKRVHDAIHYNNVPTDPLPSSSVLMTYVSTYSFFFLYTKGSWKALNESGETPHHCQSSAQIMRRPVHTVRLRTKQQTAGPADGAQTAASIRAAACIKLSATTQTTFKQTIFSEYGRSKYFKWFRSIPEVNTIWTVLTAFFLFVLSWELGKLTCLLWGC